jgi:metal-responsive CopG/Arc/MetJ family transcriptional regulator
MTEGKRPKQTAFRLPEKTLDQLDKIIDDGFAKNRTDAVILAVDKFIDPDTEYHELTEKVTNIEKRLSNIEERLS